MTFTDYLEKVTAKVRRDLTVPDCLADVPELRHVGSQGQILELFEQAHIFNLGEADDINRAGERLMDDLIEDFHDGVPAPFSNLLIFFQHPDGWGCEWHIHLGKHLKDSKYTEREKHRIWLTADLSDRVLKYPAFSWLGAYHVMIPVEGKLPICMWDESIDRWMAGLPNKSREDVIHEMGTATMIMLLRIALVSHPANYIVRTTPKLTPREERRRRKRGETPSRKKSHYIVIEHDVLINLNPANRTGSQKSPVPHARRGHWMRLAERCKRARDEGKTRVWVRDTYVGAREFEDEKHRYQVLLNREELNARDQVGS